MMMFTSFGQKAESKYHHRKPVESADDTDMKGEDTPEIENPVSDGDVGEVADAIIENTKRNIGKGQKKPHRIHPLEKFAEKKDIDSDFIPDGSHKEGADITTWLY